MSKQRASRKQKQEGGQQKQQKQQQGGKRQTRKAKRGPTAWTKFVTKVYHELKKKDKDAKLRDAMKEASRRKKNGDM